MSEIIKNVFISHVHEDDSELVKVKGLLARGGYVIRDGSINSDKPNDAKNPDYIKSAILSPNINWASTMIVLISPNTHRSEWVNWEIEYAEKQGKRIVGLWLQGAQDSDIPEALDKYADAVVGWQSERLIDAIEGKLNNWLNPDDSEHKPRNIPRYGC